MGKRQIWGPPEEAVPTELHVTKKPRSSWTYEDNDVAFEFLEEVRNHLKETRKRVLEERRQSDELVLSQVRLFCNTIADEEKERSHHAEVQWRAALKEVIDKCKNEWKDQTISDRTAPEREALDVVAGEDLVKRTSRRAYEVKDQGKSSEHYTVSKGKGGRRSRSEMSNIDWSKAVRAKLSTTRSRPLGRAWIKMGRNYRRAIAGSQVEKEDGRADVFVPYLGDTDNDMKRSNYLAENVQVHDTIEQYDSDCEEGKGMKYYSRREILKRGMLRRCIIEALQRFGATNRTKIAISRALNVRLTEVERDYKLTCKRMVEWKRLDLEKEADLVVAEQQSLSVRGLREGWASSRQLKDTDSFRAFFCRQCYTYDCHEHGINYPSPSGILPDSSLPGRFKFRTSPCGADCYMMKLPIDVSKVKQLCVEICSADLTAEELETYGCGLKQPFKCWRLCTGVVVTDKALQVIARFQKIVGNSLCALSRYIRVSPSVPKDHFACFNVALACKLLLPQHIPKHGVQGMSENKINLAKRKRIGVPNGEISSINQGKRIDHIPCNHTGPCRAKVCRCYDKGIFCEKYCCCYEVRSVGKNVEATSFCPRMFRGCNCKSVAAELDDDDPELRSTILDLDFVSVPKENVQVDESGTCSERKCPCFQLKRECDPDLCQNCCVRYPDGSIKCCGNMSLRHEKKADVLVGESQIHGWGVFAKNSIRKGACIGEYIGEIIQQDEAERRGRVYDEVNSSFLFNITQEKAVDATRHGNVLKFCNHSKSANVVPYLMKVGGDVRVGFYALRDIKNGEELVFDYGYSNVASHIASWAGVPQQNSTAQFPSGKMAR